VTFFVVLAGSGRILERVRREGGGAGDCVWRGGGWFVKESFLFLTFVL